MSGRAIAAKDWADQEAPKLWAKLSKLPYDGSHRDAIAQALRDAEKRGEKRGVNDVIAATCDSVDEAFERGRLAGIEEAAKRLESSTFAADHIQSIKNAVALIRALAEKGDSK